jgi:gamma-glutamylputrescine oxidase
MDLLTANDRSGAYPDSWYAASAELLAPFPALEGSLAADVCVIGGGYTGLSAALHLAEAGYDVVLLEAQRVGWGASGRNGGQMGSGQRRDQDWLERRLGVGTARALWEMAEAAKALVRGLVARHGIACDLRPGVIHAACRAGEVAAFHAEAAKLKRDYGYDALEPLDRAGIEAHLATRAYHGGVLDRDAAHLHPLNFALGLARAAAAAGAQIFEASRVEAIGGGAHPEVRTGEGLVRARFVIVAGNGYLGGLVPEMAARVMPINNFIVATEPLGAEAARALIRNDVAVADSRFVVNYFRLSADHRLLFGGGESYGYRFPRDIEALVRPRMLGVFPQLAGAAIDHAWGGTLAITVERLPALRRLAPNVFAAGGYSGHGVALATLAGKLMAEAVQGTAERFDLFAGLPQPRFPGGAALRWPLLVLAMSWYAMRDRL